ncbi:histidine kinase [Porticoccaceae bacterium]|nr:histidine kinase [Porticoccaceae bacterium]
MLGWAGYCLAWMISVFYAGKPMSYFFAIAGLSVLGVIITIPLRYIYRGIWTNSVITQITVVVVTSFVCSLIWVPVKNMAYWSLISGYTPIGWRDYFRGVLLVHYVFISWSCLYFGIKFYQGMEEAIQRALKATALAHEAQLKMLRYQLNPHFLFNTLNAISTLVLDEQPEKAEQMIGKLSNFLRFSLDNDPLQKVTLEQEIATLKLYLGIEKVRFEDRLSLDFQLGGLEGKALVPSLILQPIFENSIKHAVAQSETGGTISFQAKVEANELFLELRDTGPGVALVKGQLPSGRGVGIRNTSERLRQIYGGEHSLDISNVGSSENECSGLKIEIRLPYEVDGA